MSDIITIPTIEQINLEHQLANSKAAEAVQHATNCGLMLLQVKANLYHGAWLPWLNGAIESGRLVVKRSQANSSMRLAANYQRAGNLEQASSIRAALELLSDKEPSEQQGSLIDIEAERQAFAAEVGLLLAKISKNGQNGFLAIGQKESTGHWLVEMAKTSGTPFKTLQNWWSAFCRETGLSITPRQASDEHRNAFFAWLDAQKQAEEAEKARRLKMKLTEKALAFFRPRR